MELTPSEIIYKHEQHIKEKCIEVKNSISIAWINAYLQRIDADKFPKLNKLLKDMDVEQNDDDEPEINEESLSYYQNLAKLKGMIPPIIMI